MAEVEADLAAGITHVDVMIARWLEQLENGEPISKSQRLEFRRNQVRSGATRVLFGVDKLFLPGRFRRYLDYSAAGAILARPAHRWHSYQRHGRCGVQRLGGPRIRNRRATDGDALRPRQAAKS